MTAPSRDEKVNRKLLRGLTLIILFFSSGQRFRLSAAVSVKETQRSLQSRLEKKSLQRGSVSAALLYRSAFPPQFPEKLADVR